MCIIKNSLKFISEEQRGQGITFLYIKYQVTQFYGFKLKFNNISK